MPSEAMAERMCFFCDQKPRASGDVACCSCLQEHRMCYECGEKERNFPFKLCTACYTAQSARTSVRVSVSPRPKHGTAVGTLAIVQLEVELIYINILSV